MVMTTIGLDLAKGPFQVHGIDAHGKAVLRKKLARGKLLETGEDDRRRSPLMLDPARDWERELDAFLTPFLAALGRSTQRRLGMLYLRGLLGPGERKSVQPLAARLGLPSHDALHHFIADAPWAAESLARVLAATADRLVGGPDAALVVDDTALPEKGTHSVGVARQYAGALGKRANCQTLVSLTLARAEVPVALRLFLPEEWRAIRNVAPGRGCRKSIGRPGRRPNSRWPRSTG